MSAPAVSVVMGVWNGAAYLGASLDSILAQSLIDWEMIVVDDGSTDATPAMLADYAARDARIRIITNPANIGLTRSLNLAMQAARGQFVARQDADDVSRPERLARQAEALRRDPGIGVVGCWVESGSDPDAPRGLWRTPERPAEVVFELLFGNCMAHPSVMLRRELADDGGLYDESIRYAQDFELWHRLAARTRLSNLPATLYFRREHGDRIGTRHAEAQEALVRDVLRRRYGDLLSRPIGTAEVAAIRRLDRAEALTRADVTTASRLLAELWPAFRRAAGELPPGDTARLRHRLARRWLQLASRGAFQAPILCIGAALRALGRDPLAIWRALSRRPLA